MMEMGQSSRRGTRGGPKAARHDAAADAGGLGEDVEWPYPGVPAAVVAKFAGHKVAGLPFFAPETVTTDHGAVYKILCTKQCSTEPASRSS